MAAEIRNFSAVIEADARGRVSVTIPFDPAEEWGRRPRHHVRGTVNGTSFEGSLGVRGGRVFLPLAKRLREAAGVGPDDRVAVSLEPVAERTEDIPAELADVLAAAPDARAFFDGLSGFYRRQYAEWVSGAARAETRRQRAEEAAELLRQGRKTR